MTVTVNLSGKGIEFEREVSESTAVSIIQVSIAEDEAGDGLPEAVPEMDSSDGDSETLPDGFFSRLSSKQEAMLRVLMAAEEPLTSTELRRRMENNHGEETGGGRGLAGILAGFTRKYGEDFELVTVNWGDGEGLYHLNPDRPEYIDEIETQFQD
jgi:hypothetical protein